MRAMPEETNSSHPYASMTQSARRMGRITPELVQKITDRVYAMLVADLKIERERRYPWHGEAWQKGGKF